MFHVKKQLWNIISFAVTLCSPPKSFFLGYIFSIFRLSEIYYNQVLIIAERFLVAKSSLALYSMCSYLYIKAPMCQIKVRELEELGCVLTCVSLLSAFLLQMLLLFGINIIKGHFCGSIKKKVLRKSFKFVLASFPNPVFHFVLQFLTTLTKSPQIFEETGISCYIFSRFTN